MIVAHVLMLAWLVFAAIYATRAIVRAIAIINR